MPIFCERLTGCYNAKRDKQNAFLLEIRKVNVLLVTTQPDSLVGCEEALYEDYSSYS